MLRTLQLARVAGEAAKQSAHDVTALSQCFTQLALSARTSSIASRKITAPVRRAISSSFRTFASRTTAGRPKRSTATARRSTSAKKPTKRAAAKKTAKKAVKRPKKKAAPKKKPARKVLTEKQKEVREAKKKRDHVKGLKETALFGQEPKGKPTTAWSVYMSENLKGGQQQPIAESVKQLAVAFKGLALHELEQYNHTANSNKAFNASAYKSWVESHTPEQIRQANSARSSLTRLAGKVGPSGRKKTGRGYSQIKDERQVKRPVSAYFHFNVEKMTSGDLDGMAIAERSRLVKRDWDALSAGEKMKYEDLAAADHSRYVREFRSTYGHAPATT